MDHPVPEDKWLAEELRQIRAELDELKGARSAGFSNIAQGALTITDAAGVVRTRVGLLSDGTYGVEVDDAAGVPISVGGSLFGVSSDFTGSSFNLSTVFPGSAVDLGVSVDVPIGPTGRALVFYGMDALVEVLTAGSTAPAASTVFAALAELRLDNLAGIDWAQLRLVTAAPIGANPFVDPANQMMMEMNASLATAALVVAPDAGVHTLTLSGWSTQLAGTERSNRLVIASNVFLIAFPL